MAIQTLRDALIEELGDLLSAEKQLTSALPKIARKANNQELKRAFEEHLRETEGHVERLKEAFEALDRAPRSHKCQAMAGLIEEGEEILKKDAEPEAHDALIIAAAQKVEHYEIASYGTACTWAEQLGLDGVLEPLKQTLDEEKSADEKLTKLAKSINKQAVA